VRGFLKLGEPSPDTGVLHGDTAGTAKVLNQGGAGSWVIRREGSGGSSLWVAGNGLSPTGRDAFLCAFYWQRRAFCDRFKMAVGWRRFVLAEVIRCTSCTRVPLLPYSKDSRLQWSYAIRNYSLCYC
jgi:hypothetical protein